MGGNANPNPNPNPIPNPNPNQVFDLLDAGAALTGGRYRAPPLPVKSSGEGFEPKGLKGMLVKTAWLGLAQPQPIPEP